MTPQEFPKLEDEVYWDTIFGKIIPMTEQEQFQLGNLVTMFPFQTVEILKRRFEITVQRKESKE